MAPTVELAPSIEAYAGSISPRAPFVENLSSLVNIWSRLTHQDPVNVSSSKLLIYELPYVRTKLTNEEIKQVAEFCVDHLDMVPQLAEATFNLIQSAPGYRQSRPLVRRIYEESLRILVTTERMVMEKTCLSPINDCQVTPETVFNNVIAARRALQSTDNANISGGTNWETRLEKARTGDLALWPNLTGEEIRRICEEHMIDRPWTVDLGRSFGPFLFVSDEKHPQGRYVYDAFTGFTTHVLGMNAPELEIDAVLAKRLVQGTLQPWSNALSLSAPAAEYVQTLLNEGILGPNYPYLFRAESGTQVVEAGVTAARDAKMRLLLMKRMAKAAGFHDGNEFERFARSLQTEYADLCNGAKATRVSVRKMIKDVQDQKEKCALQYLHSGHDFNYFLRLLHKHQLNVKDHAREAIFFTGAFHGRTTLSSRGSSNPNPVVHQALPIDTSIKRVPNPLDLGTERGALLRKKVFAGTLTPDEKKGMEKEMIKRLDIYLKKNAEKVAVVVIEPIQGDGGYRAFSPKFLKRLQDTVRKHDVFLLFEEIQSGMGRATAGREKDGKPTWLLAQLYGLEPDFITTGKILGEGILIGSKGLDRVINHALINEAKRIFSSLGGSTAGAIQAAAVIPLLREWLPHSLEMGELFREGLRTIESTWDQKLAASENKLMGNVRGEGTMIAVDFSNPKIRDMVRGRFMENGLLTVVTGSNGIKFLFPYDCPEIAIQEMLAIIQKSLEEVITYQPDLSFRMKLAPLNNVIAGGELNHNDDLLQATNVVNLVT